MNPIYIGDIELTDETLQHYGVKGMKWGKRKAVTAEGQAAYDQLSKMSDSDYQKLLSRVKLVGRSGSSSKSSSSKASKSGSGSSKSGSSSSKSSSSSSKSSSEKKSSNESKASRSTDAKQAVKDIQEKVVYKTQVDPEYTKYLERVQARKNASKLDFEDIKKRMLTKKNRAPKFIRR